MGRLSKKKAMSGMRLVQLIPILTNLPFHEFTEMVNYKSAVGN